MFLIQILPVLITVFIKEGVKIGVNVYNHILKMIVIFNWNVIIIVIIMGYVQVNRNVNVIPLLLETFVNIILIV